MIYPSIQNYTFFVNFNKMCFLQKKYLFLTHLAMYNSFFLFHQYSNLLHILIIIEDFPFKRLKDNIIGLIYRSFVVRCLITIMSMFDRIYPFRLRASDSDLESEESHPEKESESDCARMSFSIFTILRCLELSFGC